MINQYRAGFTYTLEFDFYNDSGDRISVANPLAEIYTPLRNKYLSNVALTPGTTVGRYNLNLFIPATGMTVGHWFGVASGITGNSIVTFSEPWPFEIIDYSSEPFWLSVKEFRDYIEADDTDHTRDKSYKQMVQCAMELIEGYCKRRFGQRQYEETIEIKSTTRIKLKHYPIQQIVGLTPTTHITPRSSGVLQEIIGNEPTSFYFRLDAANGVMKLTDVSGFDFEYDGILLGISYIAGMAIIPEPVRTAALSMASKLVNLSTSEGIDSIRLSDLSFALERKLFDDNIEDALKLFRRVEIS